MISDADDQTNLRSFGNDLLSVNKKLVTTLMKETHTYNNISFSAQNLGKKSVSELKNIQILSVSKYGLDFIYMNN